MLQKVFDYVRRLHMLDQQDKIIAGISGGADSVCLLYVLKALQQEYDLTIEAVHVNHMLRGAEADGDASFTRDICEKLGVPCTVYRYPVESLAAKWGCSLEEAGRKARCEAFYKKYREMKANGKEPAPSGQKTGLKVAVAHHMDDSAETMLWNLFRGAGPKGLSGIPPVSILPTDAKEARIPLIRPLRCLSRQEIEAFLGERGIPFRIDSSNERDDYTRNKIRRHVLSYVREEISPAAVENMDRAAERLTMIENYFKRVAEPLVEESLRREEKGLSILLSLLVAQDPVIQSYMVRRCIERCGWGLKDITHRHIRDICILASGEVGKFLCLPRGARVRRTYDRLVFETVDISGRTGPELEEEQGKTAAFEISVEVPGRIFLEKTGESIAFTKKSYKNKQKIPNSAYTKWFDYDKINSPLKIRTRKPGDFFTVNKEGGRKKLKDDLIDRKMPRQQRDELPLLAEGSHVLWAFDLRISEAYKVTEDTKTILEVTRIKERHTKDE